MNTQNNSVMKPSFQNTLLIAGICLIFASCGNQTTTQSTNSTPTMDSSQASPSIKTEEVSYTLNGQTSKGYVAFDENRKGKLPVVVVLPEWWGLVDYVKMRAQKLAGLGYFAIVVDPFGNGKTAENPEQATALTKPYYTNPQMALPAVETALNEAASFPQADTSRAAAIGYCFGGFVVLNAAKLGAPLKAVVSFHGGLGGVQPKKDLLKSDILVCQGGADPFVPESDQAAFKKSMDSVGAQYKFIVYPGATHAFTNPASTANGEKYKLPLAYNGPADTASWKDMQAFFEARLK